MKMNIIKLIEQEVKNIIKESENELYNTLLSLRKNLILSAQKVYDEWEQDDEGYDEEYGTGGICDDIADSMCEVINEKTDYSCFHLYNEYDCHTSIYVYDKYYKLLYNVDIPPHVYETGYGYNWKKNKDVIIKINNVEITELSYDDYIDENGDLKNEFN
jgi:hypothetical protein